MQIDVIRENISKLTDVEKALLNAETKAFNPNYPAFDKLNYDDMEEALDWFKKLHYTDSNYKFVAPADDALHLLYKKIVDGSYFDVAFERYDLSFPLNENTKRLFNDLQKWSTSPSDSVYRGRFDKILKLVAEDLKISVACNDFYNAAAEIMRALPNENYIYTMWKYCWGLDIEVGSLVRTNKGTGRISASYFNETEHAEKVYRFKDDEGNAHFVEESNILEVLEY